ncbi:hypothetical protein [Tsukamurella soli]|uniref:Uncharacterized protein n=1 Tax=Tsukamurella soli TaxID=644556 RepID=A0ABP8JQ55_9ACTN
MRPYIALTRRADEWWVIRVPELETDTFRPRSQVASREQVDAEVHEMLSTFAGVTGAEVRVVEVADWPRG